MCDIQTHQKSNHFADHNTKQGGSGIEQHIEQKLLAVESVCKSIKRFRPKEWNIDPGVRRQA